MRKSSAASDEEKSLAAWLAKLHETPEDGASLAAPEPPAAADPDESVKAFPQPAEREPFHIRDAATPPSNPAQEARPAASRHALRPSEAPQWAEPATDVLPRPAGEAVREVRGPEVPQLSESVRDVRPPVASNVQPARSVPQPRPVVGSRDVKADEKPRRPQAGQRPEPPMDNAVRSNPVRETQPEEATTVAAVIPPKVAEPPTRPLPRPQAAYPRREPAAASRPAPAIRSETAPAKPSRRVFFSVPFVFAILAAAAVLTVMYARAPHHTPIQQQVTTVTTHASPGPHKDAPRRATKTTVPAHRATARPSRHASASKADAS